MEKGKYHSEETKDKMSIARKNSLTGFRKGRIPWNKGKRGIQVAWNKGKHPTKETLLKMSRATKGRHFSPLTEFKKGLIPWIKGKHHTEETRNKIVLAIRGKSHIWSEKGKNSFRNKMFGENNWKWIKDRSKLAKHQERNDVTYREWRMNVWLRDSFKCRINNFDCNGKIQAHHILGWKLYPELRYDINNGITLCQAHHPRKRAEEKRLIPVLQELVTVSK